MGKIFLLIASVVWGFAFVAQRSVVGHLGPYTLNAVRFFLGGLCLVPVIWFLSKKKIIDFVLDRTTVVSALKKGSVMGLLLAGGVMLQQAGIEHTTAGKAGFITGLYMVLVPFLGLFLGQRTTPAAYAGIAVAVPGLYLLSMSGDSFAMGRGDFLVLLGAVVWSFHVVMTGRFSRQSEPVFLAFIQFMVCAVLCGLGMVAFEHPQLNELAFCKRAVIYASVGSVAVAFTLQVVGQKSTAPSIAAVILGMEAAFAALGGYLFLNETLSGRELAGCALMLAGMLLAQKE